MEMRVRVRLWMGWGGCWWGWEDEVERDVQGSRLGLGGFTRMLVGDCAL